MGLVIQALMEMLPLIVILAATSTEPATAQAKLGCPETCGNLSIPYPFGTKEGCYLDDAFLITCKDSNKPFMRTGTIPVANISLDGQLRVSLQPSYDCYKAGVKTNYLRLWLSLTAFSVSYAKNKFTMIGCDTYAYVLGYGRKRYATGCASQCFAINDMANGSCSGIGCCQTDIPEGITAYNVSVYSFNNHTNVSDFNPCGFAFVVEDGKYNFSTLDLFNLSNIEAFPVVLDWSIGNKTCEKAKENPESYACKEKSFCLDSNNGPGYLCNCSDGYHGNPYLPKGCQDINECVDPSLNKCTKPEFCHNTEGNFTCVCPKGYHGDGRQGGTGCNANQPLWTKIVVGLSIGLLVLLLGISWLYWGFRQRKIIKLREFFFEQNGGIMLRQQLSKHGGPGEKTRVFTAEELKKATNNFHESRFLGQGGQGRVYKGILQDNRLVAIKKAKIGDQSQVEQFINEVVVLSQINHRNVVKLLGCCLETQVPLLVYEFVTNGTLFDHMHNIGLESFIPWETRLKIATEIAGAFSYLHSAASIPIIHRDIKSANILLDDNYTAKVSDFGASRLIPVDKEQFTTLVQGTLGYLDPEYFYTSQLSEKSDVYSFGVVLVELLTGKKAVSFDRPERERNLVTYFVCSMREDRLLEVLDHQMLNERNVEQLKEVASLARRCIRDKGEERPTMKEVTMELEGLRAMEKHPWMGGDLYPEEDEYLLGKLSDHHGGSSSIGVAGYDSIGNQVPFEIEDGR